MLFRIINIMLIPIVLIVMPLFMCFYPVIAYIFGRDFIQSIDDTNKTFDVFYFNGSLKYFKSIYEKIFKK